MGFCLFAQINVWCQILRRRRANKTETKHIKILFSTCSHQQHSCYVSLSYDTINTGRTEEMTSRRTRVLSLDFLDDCQIRKGGVFYCADTHPHYLKFATTLQVRTKLPALFHCAPNMLKQIDRFHLDTTMQPCLFCAQETVTSVRGLFTSCIIVTCPG